MAATMTNDYGTINISDGVLAKIAGISATECFGVLGLAAAEGWSDLLRKESVDRGVRIATKDMSVSIDINIIVKYGVSISAVAENIIDNVKYSVETYTGLTVESVNIIVRGIRV